MHHRIRRIRGKALSARRRFPHPCRRMNRNRRPFRIRQLKRHPNLHSPWLNPFDSSPCHNVSTGIPAVRQRRAAVRFIIGPDASVFGVNQNG